MLDFVFLFRCKICFLFVVFILVKSLLVCEYRGEAAK